jgi:sugar transferase EpsL
MNAPDIHDKQTTSFDVATPTSTIGEGREQCRPKHNDSLRHKKSTSTLQNGLKRLMDLILSSVALICLSPFLLIIALAVRVSSPGPVLFRQQRLGKGGVPFALYKFRTMYDGVRQVKSPDGSNIVLKNDPRITRVGRFLRSFSLDELPQLLNVAKGDMSLVGPRPDQLDHLEFYTEQDKCKLAMRPGLTGFAMVRGRNTIPWKERVRLDVWYVEHHSLSLDLQILMKTIPVLLFRQNVYAKAQSVDAEEKSHA